MTGHSTKERSVFASFSGTSKLTDGSRRGNDGASFYYPIFRTLPRCPWGFKNNQRITERIGREIQQVRNKFRSTWWFVPHSFRRALSHEGKRRPGWIFSLKSKGELEELGIPFQGPHISSVDQEGKQGGSLETTSTSNTQKKAPSQTPYCVKYSEKSYAILGDSRGIKEEIKAIGGKVSYSFIHSPGFWMTFDHSLTNFWSMME